MAKVLGPLFSLRAAGTFGRTLTFQGRAGSTAVFPHKVSYDPKSDDQLIIREYVRQSVYYWQTMGAPYRQAWNQFII